MLNYSRDKNEKAHTVVGRGEEGQQCDPGSELLLGGSARVVCDDNIWNEQYIY